MRLGVMVEERGDLEHVRTSIRGIAEDGFATAWIPQLMGLDALMAIALAADAAPDLELGTAVVATYPRHPIALAQQALTAQVATGGRLVLGIGVSHRFVIDGVFGMSFERPAAHMREHLDVLLPLLETGTVDVTGEQLTGRVTVAVSDAPPPPVLLAAMAPRMLALAGGVAGGTITWMTGPRTLAEHIEPALARAAADAGRPAPRLVAGLPVSVTDDIDATKACIAEDFAIYGRVPSYRAMLDREGAAGPADVALVGTEADVQAGIERMFEAGTTEFVAVPYSNRDETLEVLQGLL